MNKFHKEVPDRIAANGSNKAMIDARQGFLYVTTATKYFYNFAWQDRPIIQQYPQGMVAMQEPIWQIKPDLIIETGIAHGALIFYASILELIAACTGHQGEMLGIDIDFAHIIGKPLKRTRCSNASR